MCGKSTVKSAAVLQTQSNERLKETNASKMEKTDVRNPAHDESTLPVTVSKIAQLNVLIIQIYGSGKHEVI